MRVGRRHPGGSGSRYPRRRAAGTERDSVSAAALTLIVGRRDRKHIITVPFDHFCIQFLLHARVERSHPRMQRTRHVFRSTGWCVRISV